VARTLVVSDFHLGIGPRHAVLELARPQERLLAAVAQADRLVLLGDIVELLERPARRALPVAEPVLRAIGARLDPGAELVLVPGNHDRPLIEPWLARQKRPLQVDSAVPLDASPELRRVASWLGAERVAVRYPGAWLEPGVWATHGHYLDRHLLPESSVGAARGLLGRMPGDGALPDDYERSRRPSLSRLRSRLPGVLRWPLEQVLEFARATSMPAPPMRLVSAQMAPVTSRLLGLQMRHAAIPALARVVHRLGVRTDAVIFGHVHRLGPLPEDRDAQWRGPSGTMKVFNCGSWVYEPLLVHRASPPHPYWPGGAIVLESGRQPRAVGLLDDISGQELHRAAGTRRGRGAAITRTAGRAR
jgi:UDP-2,3-diacylglucosamine pyrophosphatase LpxH